MARSCAKIVRERVKMVALGLLPVLDSVSLSKFGVDFGTVFAEKPEHVYEIVREALDDDFKARVFLKAVLSGLVDRGSMTVDEIVEALRRKEKLNLGEFIAACAGG
ncbi:MAG: hypothetical protein ABWW70_08170 [Thermoproteota archaeon]